MAVIINALGAATVHNKNDADDNDNDAASAAGRPAAGDDVVEVMRSWAERTGLTHVSAELLVLAFLTWTRLHGVISLELAGHLAATGVGAAVLFEAEVDAIRSQVAQLPRTEPDSSGR